MGEITGRVPRHTDDPAMRRVREDLMVVSECPRYGSMIVSYRCDRIEHFLIYLAAGPSWLPCDDERVRRAAVRNGLIRNTRRTTGLHSGIGGAQWIYEITDAGRERLAAYDEAVGYRPGPADDGFPIEAEMTATP